MATLMMFVVGMCVAVGMTWDVDDSCFLSGFAMSTKAMLRGVGGAESAQLEKSKANKIPTR